MHIGQVFFVRYPSRLGFLACLLLVMLVYSQDDSSDIEDRFPARMDISLNEHTIVQGNHPRVSFSPDSLSKLKDTNDDLVILYRRRSPSTDEETIHQVKEVPQYFTDISNVSVEIGKSSIYRITYLSVYFTRFIDIFMF